MIQTATLLLAFFALAEGSGSLASAETAACRTNLVLYDARGDVTRCVVPGKTAPPTFPPAVDPDLEPGFPVRAFHGPGSYHSGPAIHTLVGNIDGDPQLEIIRTGLANGPIHAWNHDGSVVPGWPATAAPGAAYVALGELSGGPSHGEVFSGHWGFPGKLVAWNANGSPLAGWPRNSANFVGTPPALADVDGDGIDEAFIEEEDRALHGYRADGSVLPGWPVSAPGGSQERHTPAIADLDGDGDLELVTAEGTGGPVRLFAYHHGGTLVAGFPVILSPPFVDTFPAVGDVDGDGAPEIVVVTVNPADGNTVAARVYSASGVLERTLAATSGLSYGTVPALADLTGDGVPDIVIQTDSGLYAWKGDGTPVPGWPQTWGLNRSLGSSAPVIGDVTGDGLPDVVVTTAIDGESGEVRIFSRNGVLHPHFPKLLPIGPGAVPAIADIDRDSRNEIVVSGSFWNGVSGNYDILWVYDLGGGPHGPVPWSQFMGNARHTGTMETGLVPAALAVDTRTAASDLNGVLEPDETVSLVPSWTNTGPAIALLTGTSLSFTGPAAPGVTYTIPDPTAIYGPVSTGATVGCGDCYQVGVGWTGTRPAIHWDAAFEEQLSTGTNRTWTTHVGDSFADAGRGHDFYRFIETVLHHQVTSGCAGASYCPSSSTLRAQMAVFVLRARFGSGYQPPACMVGGELFNDVPASDPFCRWVEELGRRGVVSGCGGGAFCPGAPVLREQMPVFILRTIEGDVYLPPACVAGSERFTDVPSSSPFCRWVEEFARRGISGGCSPTTYCPQEPVTRGQMAVFLTTAFGLRLYGP